MRPAAPSRLKSRAAGWQEWRDVATGSLLSTFGERVGWLGCDTIALYVDVCGER